MHQLALVTGASSGIGEALCHLLAHRGVSLIISGRDIKKLKSLAKELEAFCTIAILACDLSKQEERINLIQLIKEQAPDLIVNNAGFGLYGKASELSIAEQLEMVRVNVEAVVEITLEGAKALKAFSKQGTILNVASAAAFYVFPGFATYASSKTFVVNFSKALDRELTPDGVRVLVACPGQVTTNFRARAATGTRQEASQLSMTSAFAAERILWQIEKGRGCYLFDWRYRISWLLSFLLPRSWLEKMLFRAIKRRL